MPNMPKPFNLMRNAWITAIGAIIASNHPIIMAIALTISVIYALAATAIHFKKEM